MTQATTTQPVEQGSQGYIDFSLPPSAVKGVPNLLELGDTLHLYLARAEKEPKPLARAAAKMTVQRLMDAQSYLKTIGSLASWEYEGGDEDEGEWSEEDHKQWVVNVQLAAAAAGWAKNSWEAAKRMNECYKKALIRSVVD